MSTNYSHDSPTRLILTKTLTTVSNLTETLDELLIEEKATLARLEELKWQVKETERRRQNLEDLIKETRASKGKMEMVAHDLRCLLSPMKTLPTEILLKTFSETIELVNAERRSVASKGKIPDPDQTCLLLTQVCSRWRSIFSLQPSLWRYSEFNINSLTGPDLRGKGANRLKHSVRQGVLNQQSLFFAYWDLELHEYLLPTLKSFCSPPNALEMRLGRDPAGSWDIQAVRAQSVTVYRSYLIPTCRYISPLLRSAREVTLYGNPPEWGNLPWVTLRSFVLKEFSSVCTYKRGIKFTREDLSQLLNAAPFLENLQLDFKIDETMLAWDTNLSVTHTHLKFLTVHLHHFVGGNGLFGIQLELPALRTIKFLSIHCRLASAEEEEFIYKLKTPTKLVLPELESYEVQFAAELLRWLPNVKYLDMVGENANTLLNIACAIYQHSPPLVTPILSPALTTLHIENTDILGEALVGFVQAKLHHKLAGTEGVSAMEHIEMYETPGVSVADWEKIQALLGEGRLVNSTHSSAD